MQPFQAFVARHWEWSKVAFGPGRQTGGLTQHLEKELAEIRAKPDDLSEWVDVIILALDGYLRHGGSVETIMRDLQAKQDENIKRRWPAPGSQDFAIEHDRSQD
jgi:hypothetical protein